jgi:hypothetical protein
MEYGQREIIKFLWNDGFDAHQIVIRLQAQFGEHSDQLPTVQFWIVEVRHGRQDPHDEICSGRPPPYELDCKILAILYRSPFQLSHSIAERLAVVQSTMLRHLHESLRFESFHLRCMDSEKSSFSSATCFPSSFLTIGDK